MCLRRPVIRKSTHGKSSFLRRMARQMLHTLPRLASTRNSKTLYGIGYEDLIGPVCAVRKREKKETEVRQGNGDEALRGKKGRMGRNGREKRV